MKLLFDQNLSFRLVQQLIDLYPESVHVQGLCLTRASDEVVWDYARQHGFAVASKDDDFHQRSFLLGPPPKVIWIRLGNCSTRQVAELLRVRQSDVQDFDRDPQAAFLALG